MRYIFRILKTTRALRRLYIAISVFTVGLALITLVQPLLVGKVIDELRLGSGASVGYVALLASIIFVMDFASTIMSNIGGYIGDQMSVKLQKLLSMRYYEHLLSLPQSYFDTELSGKIISRLNRSILQISNFMQMMSNNFLQFIFSTIFSLIVVAVYSWQVALMLFVLYPIFIFMTVKTSNTWITYQNKKNQHNDTASGRFAEAITQIKVVKSYLQEKHELAFFRSHLQKITTINIPQSKYWHTRDVQRRVILNIIFFGVYLFIFVRAAQGLFSPGEAVTLILYAYNIRIPIFTISFLVENTQKAIADSKDYFEVLDQEPQVIDESKKTDLKLSSAKVSDIIFDDVTFAYDKKPVLRKLSFSIPGGTKVALVGESGEGKTTITNLLMRLYEPQSGSIRIGAHNIADVTLASLRDSIGVVFQDPSLFSGTIRENIAYARPQATNEEVENAARQANAHEFIAKLENGYNTEIGERGLKLSGGQKQRIAIARALLKNAPILVLDEATSSLDSRSEQMVQEALSRLMEHRTTLIIAHRLSTIATVDTIITIKNGAVDEIGSPEELQHTNGIYSQLLALQHGSEKDKKALRQFEITN